jgi:hypothetical protein
MRVNQLSVAAPIVEIPHSNALVVTRAQQPSASRVENQVVHPVVMTYKCDKTTAALSLPDLYRFIPTATCQILTCQFRACRQLLIFTGTSIFYLLGLFFFLLIMLCFF